MLKRSLTLGFIVFAAYRLLGDNAPPVTTTAAATLPGFEFSPRLDIGKDPIQRAVRNVPAVRAKSYLVTPLASFQVAGRVLGSERYRSGREAELSPIDLAMGWGPMADSAVLASVEISQSGRFYFWHVDAFPIPAHDIVSHSANMHMLPASAAVAEALKSVRAGQNVRFKGYLVKVEGDDGWHWRSSTRRNDQGAGAWEVVLIDTIETI